MSRRIAHARALLLFGLGPIVLAPHFFAQIPTPPVPMQQQVSGPFPDRGVRCPGHGADAIPPLVTSGDQTNVPEFNDCQRFIRGGRYGALYAVFASYKVKGLLDSLKRLECRLSLEVIRVPGAAPRDPASPSSPILRGTPVPAAQPVGTGTVSRGGLTGAVSGPAQVLNTGTVVKIAPKTLQGTATANVAVSEPNFVFPSDCRANPKANFNGVGVLYAEVISWGGTYDRLGIKPNFNCLYLYDSAALKAVMVPVDMAEASCGQVIDPISVDGTRLHVRVTRRMGLVAADYPGVARWDVNPATGATYIGMACAPDVWCEIGSGIASTPTGIAGNYSRQYESASQDTKVRRVIEVKGWYDEQQLAILDAAGRPVPSGFVATMIPHPDLDSYTDASFSAGTWLPAATIVIRRQIDKYKHSLNLDPSVAPPWMKVNNGFLCRGILKQCIPDPAQRTHLKLACLDPQSVNWYAKVVSVKGDVMFRCISYYHHQTQSPIPGTVRWAWFDTDEGGWWRCPNGCCYPD